MGCALGTGLPSLDELGRAPMCRALANRGARACERVGGRATKTNKGNAADGRARAHWPQRPRFVYKPIGSRPTGRAAGPRWAAANSVHARPKCPAFRPITLAPLPAPAECPSAGLAGYKWPMEGMRGYKWPFDSLVVRTSAFVCGARRPVDSIVVTLAPGLEGGAVATVGRHAWPGAKKRRVREQIACERTRGADLWARP